MIYVMFMCCLDYGCISILEILFTLLNTMNNDEISHQN